MITLEQSASTHQCFKLLEFEFLTKTAIGQGKVVGDQVFFRVGSRGEQSQPKLELAFSGKRRIPDTSGALSHQDRRYYAFGKLVGQHDACREVTHIADASRQAFFSESQYTHSVMLVTRRDLLWHTISKGFIASVHMSAAIEWFPWS